MLKLNYSSMLPLLQTNVFPTKEKNVIFKR